MGHGSKFEILASAIPEIWMGPPKFKTCHVTYPRPFQVRFVVHRLGLATINMYTRYEVSTGCANKKTIP